MSYIDEKSAYDPIAVISFAIGGGLFYLGDKYIYPGLGIMFLIISIEIGVGVLVTSKFDTGKAIFTAIFWSNLITWLIPFLGFITGTIAIAGGRKREGNAKLYLALGLIGFGLALANSLYTVWLGSHELR